MKCVCEVCQVRQVCQKSFLREYNKKRHELAVHSFKPTEGVPFQSDCRMEKWAGEESLDALTSSKSATEMEQESDEDESSSNESSSDESPDDNSSTEEESDEDDAYNNHDKIIGQLIIEEAGEDKKYLEAFHLILNTSFHLRKSNLYRAVQNAKEHYENLWEMRNDEKLIKAIQLRSGFINQLVTMCLEDNQE